MVDERADCLVPFEEVLDLEWDLPEVFKALEREVEATGSGLGGAFRLERFEGLFGGGGLETWRGFELGHGPGSRSVVGVEASSLTSDLRGLRVLVLVAELAGCFTIMLCDCAIRPL